MWRGTRIKFPTHLLQKFGAMSFIKQHEGMMSEGFNFHLMHVHALGPFRLDASFDVAALRRGEARRCEQQLAQIGLPCFGYASLKLYELQIVVLDLHRQHWLIAFRTIANDVAECAAGSIGFVDALTFDLGKQPENSAHMPEENCGEHLRTQSAARLAQVCFDQFV